MAKRLCRWADIACYCGLIPIWLVLTLAALICSLVEFASTPPEEMRHG